MKRGKPNYKRDLKRTSISVLAKQLPYLTQTDHFVGSMYTIKAHLREEGYRWTSTLPSRPAGGRKLDTKPTHFQRKKRSWEKMKAEDSKALKINSTEFWSWEARGKIYWCLKTAN